MNISPPTSESELTDPKGPEKRWHVGTLTYTTAGLVILFCWLLWGDFAWSMKDRSVQPVFQKLIQIAGASNTLAGVLLVFLPAGLGLLISPYISYRSDRHRGRWGRRIPFLLIPTPFAVLGMAGLAMSPYLGKHVHGVSSLVFLGVFWTIFETATTVANSVYGALLNDVVPRPVLGRFYAMFRAVSLIAGIIFTFWLLGKAPNHYVAIFVSTGLLYGVGFVIMGFKVKEGNYPPVASGTSPTIPAVVEGEGLEGSPESIPVLMDRPDDETPNSAPMTVAQETRSQAIVQYLKNCFGKRYYFWFYAAIILPTLASLPINTFNQYFSDSVGMSLDTFGKLQALYFVFSLLQTLPLGWLVDRYDPMRVSIVAIVLHGSAALWGGFFAHSATTFGIAYVLTGTLSGTFFTASASLGALLLPKMKFAQYLSAMAIVDSLTKMICGPAVGRWLDHTQHQFGHTMYHHTYMIGGVFDILGLIATVVLLGKFLARGGKKNYVAP